MENYYFAPYIFKMDSALWQQVDRWTLKGAGRPLPPADKEQDWQSSKKLMQNTVVDLAKEAFFFGLLHRLKREGILNTFDDLGSFFSRGLKPLYENKTGAYSAYCAAAAEFNLLRRADAGFRFMSAMLCPEKISVKFRLVVRPVLEKAEAAVRYAATDAETRELFREFDQVRGEMLDRFSPAQKNDFRFHVLPQAVQFAAGPELSAMSQGVRSFYGERRSLLWFSPVTLRNSIPVSFPRSIPFLSLIHIYRLLLVLLLCLQRSA